MNDSRDIYQPEEVLVKVRNLVKYFIQRGGFFESSKGVVKAVDDVSLDCRLKHTLGVVGESGCGKTTLARCILRLIEPTAGEVLFEGVNILALSSRKLRELRRDMQIVYQNPFSSLDPRMNVQRIIGEPLRAHSSIDRGQLRDRVVQLLEQVGMTSNHLYRYPHEFSGGQLQRIAIARALALNPRFLVLDEPTAALDVSVQAQIINLLIKLQRALGLTYLFISHNINLVHYVSDSIAVLYLGRIVELGSAEEIMESPLHPYTKALLSSIPSLNPKLRRQRILLRGGVADPANPPSGCGFHPRCLDANTICSRIAPDLVDVGDGRLVSCHFWQEE